MASVYRYICKTCNTDLGSDGASVKSHLVSNPTHSIKSLLCSDTQTVASIQGQTRIYNGELFTYDQSRVKWLSNRRIPVEWGYAASGRNIYLRL